MLGIFTLSPQFGASVNLFEAFESQGLDCMLIYGECDPYKSILPKKSVRVNRQEATAWIKLFRRKEHRILFATEAMLTWLVDCGNPFVSAATISSLCKAVHPPSIILGGTEYRNHFERINTMMDQCNVKYRFSAMELLHLGKNIPFIYPMEYNSIDTTKNKTFTVATSPGLSRREKRKGLLEIEKGVKIAQEEVFFDFDLIVGVTHVECLKRKAKAHVFIDQIRPDIGGVGKNGFEGVALDCVTICSSDLFYDNYKNYPPAPILCANDADEIADLLIDLVGCKYYYNARYEEVKAWKHWIGYEHTVNYMKQIWSK